MVATPALLPAYYSTDSRQALTAAPYLLHCFTAVNFDSSDMTALSLRSMLACTATNPTVITAAGVRSSMTAPSAILVNANYFMSTFAQRTSATTQLAEEKLMVQTLSMTVYTMTSSDQCFRSHQLAFLAHNLKISTVIASSCLLSQPRQVEVLMTLLRGSASMPVALFLQAGAVNDSWATTGNHNNSQKLFAFEPNTGQRTCC